jgi:hypothetical protein
LINNLSVPKFAVVVSGRDGLTTDIDGMANFLANVPGNLDCIMFFVNENTIELRIDAYEFLQNLQEFSLPTTPTILDRTESFIAGLTVINEVKEL